MGYGMQGAIKAREKRNLAYKMVTRLILDMSQAKENKPFTAADAVAWGKQRGVGESAIKHRLQDMTNDNLLSAYPSTYEKNVMIYTVMPPSLMRLRWVDNDNQIPLGRYYP